MARTRRASLTALLVAVALAYAAAQLWDRAPVPEPDPVDAAIVAAFEARRSGLNVASQGEVERILRDDLDGSRHQRFIVRLDSGLTLLLSHNIDLAPRVPLESGDAVRFRGDYEWNERGGVVHWTHRDPDGRHPSGFIEHRGRRYD